MRNRGIIGRFIDAIRDPEREFTERVYLALTVVSEFTVFIAFIGDILTRENPYEIAVILGTLIAVPVIMIVCFRKNKLQLAIRITVLGVSFIVLPALYIFGGGVEGGGVLWIIFTFTFAGLVLTGTWRRVIFVIIFIMSTLCYLLEYYYPELIYEHTREIFLVDSYLSVILVGIVCFVMTWLQNKLYADENLRAKKAAEKAEELTKTQNRFFSSMSHEIRTPINSILGLNELILRDQSASDEIIKDAIGIQGSGKMLLSLINDLLDFSKIEAGNMTIVPVDYRIGDMLTEIVNMIWLKADEKGIAMNVSVDPTVPSVLYGDEIRIKQIIINLLNNAVKYTGAGSVDLHVESEQKDENTVELSITIADTGMGIKKEVIPYLFDAFKRVDEEKNRHIEGTGLGLSIVKQLVELMEGTITVNSVYGEGSTFTVTICQGISDSSQIGELNIHNQNVVDRTVYECSFRAPDARILIVDDNAMNLEVEAKLLADTGMIIDTAINGREALDLDLKHHYDVIFMDHLMPGMDGIQCLEKVRNHAGGMNRSTPVIVLTANAGSDNRELYNRVGFDGYLVKPVSGESLENTLMKFISKDKLIILNNKVVDMIRDINAAAGYSGKAPVIITTTSICDLPAAIIKRLHIPILPLRVRTEEGSFKDGIQLGADELIRYINTGRNAVSAPPEESAYTDFFTEGLKKAHHLIHISLTTSMSEEYNIACEAAKSFDNVTVINSESLSSTTGILVLIAYKLAQMNDSVEEIVEELEAVKKRLRCSFVINTTEYMARKGYLNAWIDRVARVLNIHPGLIIKNDRLKIGSIWIGKTKRAYRYYIAQAFPVNVAPDPEVVFITYANIPKETLMWVKEEINKYAHFENVIFKQASAAISSNCGPGTLGVLYIEKTNKSYNLSGFFNNYTSALAADSDGEQEGADIDYEDDVDGISEAESVSVIDIADIKGTYEGPKWYDSLEGIDGNIAITNSGSEDAFKSVLKIFYESVDDYSKELQGFYDADDWEGYTIKVHALKSSCKLIGAIGTSKKAEQLEMAGKENNIGYIKGNHDVFMEEYLSYKDKLKSVFEVKEEEKVTEKKKPVADAFLMESVYEGIRDAAEAMDSMAIEEILKEVSDYEIPEAEAEKYNSICRMAGQFDYDGIAQILKQS